LSYTYPLYIIGKENSESFLHALFKRMRQLVTLGELSSDVDTTGTGSMRVVVSRVAISYGCPASFWNAVLTSASYTEKHSVLGQQRTIDSLLHVKSPGKIWTPEENFNRIRDAFKGSSRQSIYAASM
jgi:hypothetical protein